MSQITDTARFALLAGEAGFDPIEERLRANVRATIEAVFKEELAGFLGRLRYDRGDGPAKGHRNRVLGDPPRLRAGQRERPRPDRAVAWRADRDVGRSRGRRPGGFHVPQSIVVASHSRSLTTLYGALSELLQQSHVERRRVTHQHRKVVGDLIAAHRQVFLSIVAKKPDEADQRLREHFAIGDELRRRSLIEAYRKGPETSQH